MCLNFECLRERSKALLLLLYKAEYYSIWTTEQIGFEKVTGQTNKKITKTTRKNFNNKIIIMRSKIIIVSWNEIVFVIYKYLYFVMCGFWPEMQRYLHTNAKLNLNRKI